MTRTLLRQDPALCTLRGSLPLALVAGLFVGALITDKVGSLGDAPLGPHPAWFAFIYCQIWAVLTIFIVSSHVTVRSAQMNLALPIPVRTLWAARIISLTAAWLLPLAVLTLLISFHRAIFQGGGDPEPALLRLGAMTAAGLMLVVTALQSPSPGLCSIRVSWKYILYAVLVSVGTLLVILLGPRTPVMVIALLGASAVLGLLDYASLPPSLSLASRKPRGHEETLRPRALAVARQTEDEAMKARPTYSPSTEGSTRGLLQLTVFRVLANHPLTWIVLPITLFYGDRLIFAYRGGWELQSYFLLLLIWIVALLFQAIMRMHKLDPLPISRGILLAYAMAPFLLALALGAGIGKFHLALNQHPPKMISCYCRGQNCDEFSVNVPPDSWEIVWNGKPPVITSPWGETYPPTAHPLYRGSSVVLYNPYEVGSESSPRFIELQLDRAIAAIHGVASPGQEELPANRSDDAIESPQEKINAKAAWAAGLGSSSRSKTMATRILLLGVFTAAVLSLGLQQFRAATPRHVYPWLLQGLALPLMLIVAAVYIADRTGYASFLSLATFPEVLTRKLSEAIPLSVGGLWLLAAAGLACGYLLILSRFKKVEAPVQRRKKMSEY